VDRVRGQDVDGGAQSDHGHDDDEDNDQGRPRLAGRHGRRQIVRGRSRAWRRNGVLRLLRRRARLHPLPVAPHGGICRMRPDRLKLPGGPRQNRLPGLRSPGAAPGSAAFQGLGGLRRGKDTNIRQARIIVEWRLLRRG
jgi:hypothetical protein